MVVLNAEHSSNVRVCVEKENECVKENANLSNSEGKSPPGYSFLLYGTSHT